MYTYKSRTLYTQHNGTERRSQFVPNNADSIKMSAGCWERTHSQGPMGAETQLLFTHTQTTYSHFTAQYQVFWWWLCILSMSLIRPTLPFPVWVPPTMQMIHENEKKKM